MKSIILSTIVCLAVAVTALPTDPITYGPPPGGWESIDWTKITYPPGTGANLPSYPPGTGENLPSYPPGTGENLPYYPPPNNAPPDNSDKTVTYYYPTWSPFTFTSTFSVHASPDQVVNGTTPTGGLRGASGDYLLGLNSVENVICYNITLSGFGGETYSSPARTATHLHEAARGQSGSPRIVFDNPVDIGNGIRRSVGCVRGPFMTGLPAGGPDSGANFNVAQIEANCAGFFVDVHTGSAVPGAVRGQLG